MRRWLPYAGIAGVGALVWTPQAAMPQDMASLQGRFAWDSTAGDDVAEAIEAGTAGMGFPHRRFARRHLEAANRPYRTITIEQDEETISIATDGGEPIRAPASGAPIDWMREDGEQIRVSIVREDGAIRQTFTAEDEERETVFRPSADGQGLTLAVTVRMARLPNAIRYELVYRPAEQSRMRPFSRYMAGAAATMGALVVADQILPDRRWPASRTPDSRAPTQSARAFAWKPLAPADARG